MLQSIRDRTQGWISGVIISLVILSFALWGVHSYMNGGSNTSIVAKVNGTEISKSQLASAYERMRRQIEENVGPGNLPEKVESDLRIKALDALINVQVLKQGSLQENYRVSSTQIDGFLESMPQFQVDGRFSLPRLQQFLSTTLLSAGDFLELIKTNLLIEQPRLGIIFSSFALPDEVSNTIALVNQERDIDYMVLSRDYFLKQNLSVSEDEIKSYYQSHQNEFKTPEQVSIEYLELSAKDLLSSIHPSEDVLKAYYNDNINSYTKPMQWEIETVLFPLAENATPQEVSDAEKAALDARRQVLNGKDLSAQASELAAGATKKWVSLSEVPAEQQKALALLTKADQVSEPIRTANGFQLIKVFAVKEPQVQPFAAVKDKVLDTVAHQKAQEKYAELREKLANVSYEYPDSLQPAAKALGLTAKTSEFFTQAKGGKDISENKKVRDAAFSPDVLNSQNNSDVIQINADTTIVLRIKTHTPAALLPIESVHKQIVDQITAIKAEQKAKQVAEEIKLKLQSGLSEEQIAKDYPFTWNKEGYIGRYSTKIDTAILYAAFRMPRPAKANSAALYAAAKIPSGYAVVALHNVKDGSIEANKEQLDVFNDQVQNSEGLLEYKLYEQTLMKAAKITSYLDYNNSPD
jgi:peptidyl-prolyl cis-trans isomerase D